MAEKIKCPACSGTGKLPWSIGKIAAKRLAAREMRREGATIREIRDALGYRSASGVHFLLYDGKAKREGLMADDADN